MASALDPLKNFPFRRLNALLEGLEPGQEPLFLQIGEPQGAVPELAFKTVTEHLDLLGKYPPPNGSPDYLRAVADWLESRYHPSPQTLDPSRQITALCGTREGLFQAALVAIHRKRDHLNDPAIRPAVLAPNPMYHVYFGGAVMGDADVILLNTAAQTGFLPDYASISTEYLDRTAICYLCTPGNPTGAVASRQTLAKMLALARKHNFILAVDECYSEIWFTRQPAGGFDAVTELGVGFDNLLTFNSLSKRSGVPGLRCGFAAGDPDLIRDLSMVRAYGGAQVPGSLMAAGAALWRDHKYSEDNRNRYKKLVEIADAYLKDIPGYTKPEAGFFLWLDISQRLGDGEKAAQVMWQHAGLKVLPGRYMSRPDPVTGESPGDGFIRIALVHDPKTVETAMQRLASLLTQT